MKILLITNDIVGDTVAGPGIRYTEIANALVRRGHSVTVVGKETNFKNPQRFNFAKLRISTLYKYLRTHDRIVIRGGGPLVTLLVALFSLKKDVIADIYTFTHFEVPHLSAGSLLESIIFKLRENFHPHKLKIYANVFNKFWVANQRQKNFLQGVLYATGQSPENKPIFIVPFGYPEDRPRKNSKVLKGVIKGINENDFVLIWAGGIWDWLDPVTLLKAMAILKKQGKPIKLFFMGLKAPSGYLSNKAREALDLAKKLGIYNKNVFFNMHWIPYEQRHEYLLEADAGITLHPVSLETEFSFRTRTLDYIYCSLPMIHTEGDTWAELIKSTSTGIVVPPADTDAVVRAILRLYEDSELRNSFRKKLEKIFNNFTWQSIAEEIQRSLETPVKHNLPVLKVMTLLKEYFIFSLKVLPVSLTTAVKYAVLRKGN